MLLALMAFLRGSNAGIDYGKGSENVTLQQVATNPILMC